MTIICLKKSCTFCSILAYIVRIQYSKAWKKINIHSFSALEINFESYTTLSVTCVCFNNYLIFNITAKKNWSYMYWTFIWQRTWFFFTRECKYIATCLSSRQSWKLTCFVVYLFPLSFVAFHSRHHLCAHDFSSYLGHHWCAPERRFSLSLSSLQHKQNVQFFKYTTVERMNIYQANEYRIIFIHFCHANLRVWGENTYTEW